MHSYYAHDSNYLIMSSAVSFCSIRPIEKYSHTAKHWCFQLKNATNEIKDTFWFYMKFKILWKLYMKIYILKYIWKLPTIWDKEEQPQSCVKSQSLIWPSFTGSNTCGPWCCRANYRAELFSHICWLSNSDSLLLTKLNRVAFLLYRDLQMWVWKRGSALRESRKKVIIKAVFWIYCTRIFIYNCFLKRGSILSVLVEGWSRREISFWHIKLFMLLLCLDHLFWRGKHDTENILHINFIFKMLYFCNCCGYSYI